VTSALQAMRDIYLSPGQTARRGARAGVREDRALAMLIAGCALVFMSQWPVLARQAALDPTAPLDARLGGALFAWLAVMPIAFYVLAALSHLLARLLGGQGSFATARAVLFRAVFAAAPLWLVWGAVTALAGGGATVERVSGAAALAGFLWLWLPALVATERGESVDAAG